MASAKDLVVKPISAKAASTLVKRVHYSGKTVQNSQLHLGVYLSGKIEGAMQFGPSLDKRKIQGLVEGTEWNGFIELNRMAFSERLPRNSESRAIAIAMKLIRKHYPGIEWVISFADGTQCGDGTIYRASGFALTGLRKNTTIVTRPDGTIGSELSGGKHTGGTPIEGFQLRYIYFINPDARQRLTVPVIPFSRIEEVGARMYKGKPKREKQAMTGPTGTATGQHRSSRSNSVEAPNA